MNFFIGFLITFLIELIIYFIAFKNEKNMKIVFYCFLINSFTWPLANFFYSLFGFFYIIELGIILIEILLIILLFKTNWKKALLVSLIANITTASIGLLVFFLQIF
jgi:hypothetical protein